MSRILFIALRPSGGSFVSLYHLIQGLTQESYTCNVLFHKRKSSHLARKLNELGVSVSFLDNAIPSDSVPREVKLRDIAAWLRQHAGTIPAQTYTALKFLYQFIRDDLTQIRDFYRAIQRAQPDLIHLNNGLRNHRAAIIAARLLGIPCVCHMRAFREWNLLDRRLARWVKHFIYISNAIQDHYRKQGIPAHKGTVVHNAVNVSLFTVPYDVSTVRSGLGLTQDDVVIGNVGRLDWWKGHEFFLEAMARVAETEPRLKCLVVGDSDGEPRNVAYHRQLVALTKSLGLSERVIFTGFRDDIPRIMTALDVLVHSASEPEPFGRVIIEGMAAAKPVVATAAGGVLDIIEDGVNGTLVPCQDATALARAVLWFLSHKDQATQMGTMAQTQVKEKFTLQHHARQIQQLYGTILTRTTIAS